MMKIRVIRVFIVILLVCVLLQLMNYILVMKAEDSDGELGRILMLHYMMVQLGFKKGSWNLNSGKAKMHNIKPLGDFLKKKIIKACSIKSM